MSHFGSAGTCSAAGLLRSAALLGALVLAGCASTSEQAAQRAADRRSAQSCVRLPSQAHQHDGSLVSPNQPHGATPEVAGFSAQAVGTARDIGVLPLLIQLADSADVDADAADRLRLQALHIRQRLSDRVLLALLDVQGVVAELECERDRGERLEFILAQAQGRRDRRLALSGLIIGAVTSIVSGGIAIGVPQGNSANVIGIVGGGAEAGVGAAGLSGEAAASLRTERNLLREIWEGPAASRLLPPMVWRLLTEPAGRGRNGRSIRDELVAQWRSDNRFDDPSSPDGQRQAALLFGDGGRYSPEDLQLREMLLDSMQARVWLISMDLEQLLREIIQRSGRATH